MEHNDMNARIENFLDGKLTESDATAFRREMTTDKSLSEAVGLARLERLMKAQLLDQYMEGKLAQWQNETDSPSSRAELKKNRKINRFWWLLSLPLLIAGIWFFDRYNQRAGTPATPPPTAPVEQPPVLPEGGNAPVVVPNDKPIKEPLPPKDLPIAQKSPADAELLAWVEENDFIPVESIPHGTRGPADELAKAEKALQSGNTAEAIAMYEKVAKENGRLGLEAAWNLALLFFEQKKYKEALPWFEKVAANDSFLYQDDARYLLVLCRVAARQFKKAESLLKELIEKDYFEDAASKAKAEQLKKQLAGW